MKLTCISILLVCLLAATFGQGLIILSYRINQKYIASTLCVNRNNPAAHCNGHCYLKKQLNNEEQPANPLGTAGKEKMEVQLFFSEGDPFAFYKFVSGLTYNSAAPYFTPQFVLREFLKPPCA